MMKIEMKAIAKVESKCKHCSSNISYAMIDQDYSPKLIYV
jgi:hypothetical protein